MIIILIIVIMIIITIMMIMIIIIILIIMTSVYIYTMSILTINHRFFSLRCRPLEGHWWKEEAVHVAAGVGGSFPFDRWRTNHVEQSLGGVGESCDSEGPARPGWWFGSLELDVSRNSWELNMVIYSGFIVDL